MAWWGKLLGGAFGFMIGGPLGALIGAAVGHNLDAGLKRTGGPWQEGMGFDRQERTQTAFFTATFSVMGHVAKADGRVSPDEINLAEQLMQQMGLSDSLREVARRLFNEGKASDFPLDDVLDQFRIECRASSNLLRMFVEIQLQAVFADGEVHRAERELLAYIAEKLRLPPSELNHLEAMLRAGPQWHGGKASGQRLSNLDDAYAVLGIKADAADDDVKRAYRRLMSQHHPDKLVSKGLPEEMMKMATQKTQEIKAAYEQVKEARGT